MDCFTKNDHPYEQKWSFTPAQREVIGLLPRNVQDQVRSRGAHAVLKEACPQYCLPGMTTSAALLGLVAVHRSSGTVEQATALLDDERTAEEAKREEREDERFRKSQQALMRDGGYSDPEADEHAEDDDPDLNEQATDPADEQTDADAQGRVYAMLSPTTRERIRKDGLKQVFDQEAAHTSAPRLQVDFGLPDASHMLLTLLQWQSGTNSSNWQQAKKMLLADQDKDRDESAPARQAVLKAMQERLKERAAEQEKPKTKTRWHFTPEQSWVLETLSEEDREYALEHGPAALAKEVHRLDARRWGGYTTDGKSASRLLHDAVLGRRLGAETVRAAHVTLFGTVSEFSTPQGEAELNRLRPALALLPPITQQAIHADGTARQIAQDSLGPYGFAELDVPGDPAAAERVMLAALVRKYVRDDDDRERALAFLGQGESVLPSPLEPGWERDSLEFGKPQAGFKQDFEQQVMQTVREAEKRAAEHAKAQAVVPTREQSAALGGATVVADTPTATPPAGPVVKSVFHDIVEKVKAVPPHDRADLFAELADYIPVATVVRFLERGGPAVKYTLADLSAEAREGLVSQALKLLGVAEFRRVLGGATQALTGVEREELAETLLKSLPEHVCEEVIYALGDKLSQSLREALGLRSALSRADISLTFADDPSGSGDDQD